jgi:hypothetical protein
MRIILSLQVRAVSPSPQKTTSSQNIHQDICGRGALPKRLALRKIHASKLVGSNRILHPKKENSHGRAQSCSIGTDAIFRVVVPKCQGRIESDKEGGSESDDASLFDESVIGSVRDIVVTKNGPRRTERLSTIFMVPAPCSFELRRKVSLAVDR